MKIEFTLATSVYKGWNDQSRKTREMYKKILAQQATNIAKAKEGVDESSDEFARLKKHEENHAALDKLLQEFCENEEAEDAFMQNFWGEQVPKRKRCLTNEEI